MKNQEVKLSAQQLQELDLYKANKECSATELKRILAILLIDRQSPSELITTILKFV